MFVCMTEFITKLYHLKIINHVYENILIYNCSLFYIDGFDIRSHYSGVSLSFTC